jgi:predicted metal-binding protein
MLKHTLFVCQSCCLSEDHSKGQPADGKVLLEQVRAYQAESSSDIRVQPVACLWACGSPCVVAFSAPSKPTYLFSKLPTVAASDLIKFAEQYTQSKTGNVSYKQFPERLKEVAIAKVPYIR